jgi:hypothetical protein
MYRPVSRDHHRSTDQSRDTVCGTARSTASSTRSSTACSTTRSTEHVAIGLDAEAALLEVRLNSLGINEHDGKAQSSTTHMSSSVNNQR